MSPSPWRRCRARGTGGRTTSAWPNGAVPSQAWGNHPTEFRQWNAEHQLVDRIHEAIDHGSGTVINPAGLTFRSIPILDALRMFPGPIYELHISTVHRREEICHHSLISRVATAVIMGLRPDGYPTAVSAMVRLLETNASRGAACPLRS